MTQARQKSDERAHYDFFEAHLQEFPMKLLRHDENPDFLVEREGRTVGIEHTELFKRRRIWSKRPYTPAELEGVQQNIVRDAEMLYVAGGNPPLSVKVWFDTTMRHRRLARARPKAMAAELSRFLAERVRQIHPDRDVQLGYREIIPIDGITGLSVSRGGSQWRKEGPSVVGPPLVAELQDRITEKDARYGVYRQKCDECWLLIVADWRNPAQGFILRQNQSPLEHRYRSRFDRIFFLEMGDGVLRELKRAVYDEGPDPVE